MYKENYLSEKIQNYNVRIYNDRLIENIEIFDLNNNQIKTLDIENSNSIIGLGKSLDFSTSEYAYNFTKILCYLKNGLLLVYQNSFHERTSRDGVDLSTDNHYTEILNLNTLKYEYVALKKDRFGNEEKNVGKFYGTFSFKIDEKHQIGFNVFENLVISNCIFNKYIITTQNINISEFFEIIEIHNLNKYDKFLMLDNDFNIILKSASLLDIVDFFSKLKCEN